MKKLILVIFGLLSLSLITPAPASAASDVVCGDTLMKEGDCAKTTSFTFAKCKSANVSIKCLMVEVISFLSIGVGIAVVAGIAIGGIQYATSQGNPAGAQKGITTITNAIIGLVLYLLLFALLQFLIPGGVLS
ncbi:MAG: hypothetical protein ABIQ64_00960 [Candidatus Saccharimonadales bacterium]